MDLTTNHLSTPEFRHLLYIIKNQEIYNNQLVITHIFQALKYLNTEVFLNIH